MVNACTGRCIQVDTHTHTHTHPHTLTDVDVHSLTHVYSTHTAERQLNTLHTHHLQDLHTLREESLQVRTHTHTHTHTPPAGLTHTQRGELTGAHTHTHTHTQHTHNTHTR